MCWKVGSSQAEWGRTVGTQPGSGVMGGMQSSRDLGASSRVISEGSRETLFFNFQFLKKILYNFEDYILFTFLTK